MNNLKFNRVGGATLAHGRWVSDCGRISVMKFSYKVMPDPPYAKRVTPYFNAYDLGNFSRRFASDLRSWRAVVKACEEYHPEVVG